MPATQSRTAPIAAVRSSNVLTVEVDEASRYTHLFHLLCDAVGHPEEVEEDLDRLRWDLVYGSITAARKAERVVQVASRLLTA